MMTHQLFVQAETDYRLARASAQFDRSTAEERYRRPRRRLLPRARRRSLRLA